VWTSIGLCALVAVPGVVDQDDLDARWINALPALGVALAVGLLVAAVRRDGAAFVRSDRGDRLRITLAVVLLVLALPWLAADSGFYFPGDVFLGEEVQAERDPRYAAVHLGFHHGLAGSFLAVSALLLSRIPAGRVLRGYVSLMLAYGLALALQDTWTEQLWKRGTTDWHAPDVIRPDLSWSWLAIVVGAIAMYALWFGQTRMSAVTHPP